MDAAITKMVKDSHQEINRIKKLEACIFKVDRTQDTSYLQRFREMAEAVISIDEKRAHLMPIKDRAPGLIEECSFLLRDRSVYQNDLKLH